MQGMMLHCGGQPASFEDICNVEPPPITDTYRTVPHGDLVRCLEDRVRKEIQLDDPTRAFGLNREGNQMFGTLTYSIDLGQSDGFDLTSFELESAVRDYGFTIAFRNSYDKSMSLAMAIGAKTFVCDNLMIHGDWLTIFRRHTPNVWDDVVNQSLKAISNAAENWIHSVRFLEGMKGYNVPLDTGYESIGLGLGRGVLTPTQANVAVRDWRKTCDDTNHHFHQYSESAYALYQSFTESLKLGGVSRKIDQYTGASTLFEEMGFIPSQTVEDAELVN